jgi:hypothetical protein
MKNMRISICLLSLAGVVLLSLIGCAANQQFIEDRGEYWLARSVDDLKQDIARPDSYASKHNWPETSYPMADGYYGIVEPIEQDCAIHWKINPRHKVVGYEAKGSRCDKRTSKDEEYRNLKETTKQSTYW